MLDLFAERVAIIERIGCERVIIEICATRGEVEKLTRNFGGTFKRVPRTLSFPRSKPLKVGTRLVITDGRSHAHWGSRRHLIIPAAGAFGTGEHATTAMCLRLIERVTRRWRNDWIMLDAGTGSGILALAGRCLGADRVIAIDNDPRAIAIAKSNARLNRIRGIRFEIADAKKPDARGKVDLIVANLFSELLDRGDSDLATAPEDERNFDSLRNPARSAARSRSQPSQINYRDPRNSQGVENGWRSSCGQKAG